MGVVQARRLLLLALLPAAAAAAPSPPADPPVELRDLYYGEALYQLYQRNWFDAIVRLLVAHRQGHMRAHGDDPDLLLGGLYLAYGMPDAAESLFDRLLARSATPQIRDRVWLALAKSRHRRTESAAALDALAAIGDALPARAAQERHALEGLIDLERGDSARALAALGRVADDGDWSGYGRFNEAIALLRERRSDQAIALLARLADADADATDDEAKALRDRANLLRGYLLLATQQPAPARAAFEQVRLSGLAANRALLGVGWAAVDLGDPRAALTPWQRLAARDAHDPAVLEALLAIPYALSQLAADRQALEHYRSGIARLDQEHARLDHAIGAIGAGELLVALQPRRPHSADTGDDLIALLPLLLAENRFQERLLEYRDLLFLEANLNAWRDKIDGYREMLAVRRAAYAERLPRVEARLAGDEVARLTAARDRLHVAFARARDATGFGLATAEELAQIERLEGVDRRLAALAGRAELTTQRTKARLLRGLLDWRVATAQPERLRRIEKRLHALDAALAEAATRQAALREAHRQTAGRFEEFSRRIARLENRIPDLLAATGRARAAQGRLLEEMAITLLERRKGLLNDYLIQARFGVANLLDRSRPTAEAAP